MCGRFTQFHSAEAIAKAFMVDTTDLSPRYNVLPSNPVGAIAPNKIEPPIISVAV
jgi:putative SOS response-associated peptidase YedK